MRVRRKVGAAALGGMVVVLLAGCAPAPVTDITYGNPRLGLEGASVQVLVTFKCQPGLNVAFGGALVSQSHDGKLAQGFGSFSKAFPGVPCTGGVQGGRITVFNDSPWSFREGSAAVAGDVTLFNPDTGDLPTVSVDPQAVKIVDEAPRPAPTSAGPPTLDPRYRNS